MKSRRKRKDPGVRLNPVMEVSMDERKKNRDLQDGERGRAALMIQKKNNQEEKRVKRLEE